MCVCVVGRSRHGLCASEGEVLAGHLEVVLKCIRIQQLVAGAVVKDLQNPAWEDQGPLACPSLCTSLSTVESMSMQRIE
jgi:hypothetical protein